MTLDFALTGGWWATANLGIGETPKREQALMDFDQIRHAWMLLRPDFGWAWNLFLAAVPLLLALVLFRWFTRRNLLWWLGVFAFVVFLPNAAYMLTDVLHLVRQIRREPYLPLWEVCLIVMPQYAAIMLFGIESHVLSLIMVGDYLRRNNRNRWVIPIELLLNLLCSFGIYLGRFQRLNSWDLATAPEKEAIQILEDLANKFAVEVTLVGFVILTLIYYLFKFVNVAVIEYVQRRRTTADVRLPLA
jgi:uncharacterized membrane protein